MARVDAIEDEAAACDSLSTASLLVSGREDFSAASERLQAIADWARSNRQATLAAALECMTCLIEVAECQPQPEEKEKIIGHVSNSLRILREQWASPETLSLCNDLISSAKKQWGEYLDLFPVPETLEEGDEPWDDPYLHDPDEGSIEAPSDLAAIELLRRLAGVPTPSHNSSGSAVNKEECDRVLVAHAKALDQVPVEAPQIRQESKPPEQAKVHTSSPQTRQEHVDGVSQAPAPINRLCNQQAIAEAQTLKLDDEIREAFLLDADDLLARLQSMLADPASANPLELRRCLHTLKGAAGTIGLIALSHQAHELEDEIERFASLEQDGLLARLERFLSDGERVVRVIRGAPQRLSDGPVQPLPGHPSELAESEQSEGSSGIVRISTTQLETFIEIASDLLVRRRFWRQQAKALSDIASLLRNGVQRTRAQVDRLAGACWPTSGMGRSLESIVRKFEEPVEDLNVIASSIRIAAPRLADEAETLDRQSLQLWELIQSLRFIPARSLLQRLSRVAQEAARVEGKKIQVLLRGEEVDLDRSVAERVYEPLMHTVRNAVAHGIEMPDQRLSAGKRAAGTIVVEVLRECGGVVLAVEDDGGGLDYAAIEAKARRLGILSPSESASPERLRKMIFLSGFSTRENTGELAGRGVGMDVVASIVDALRGRIELSTQTGRGTRLEIHIPARLDLVPALITRVGPHRLGVPIAAIRCLQTVPQRRDSKVCIDGMELDLIHARSIFRAGPPPAESCPRFLVIEGDSKPFVLRVDGVEGAAELVTRPLPTLVAGHPALSGLSRTMAGELVFLLDIRGLFHVFRQTINNGEPIETAAVKPTALVVDDSISVRRHGSKLLRERGFLVHEAADGQEALSLLARAEGGYRLLLTDLEMPRLDGFDLLAELGRNGIIGQMPVVLTSTRSDLETRRRAADLGAVAFLAKPIDTTELDRVLSTVLVEPSLTC